MTPHIQEYRDIQLDKGLITRVTKEDYILYGQIRWYARWNAESEAFYVTFTAPGPDGERRKIYLHRLILGLEFGDPRKGDHINHDTLNNIHTDDPATNNLRIATNQQNSWNSKVHRDAMLKGASYSTKKKLWRSRIKVDGKEIFLGYFKTAEEASLAYFNAALKHFGKFACAG